MTDAPDWRTPPAEELLDAVARLRDREEAARFLRDLCTAGELHDLSQRWHVVRLLDEGRHYLDIARETGASTATVTRVASWLRHGTGGYPEALARRAEASATPAPARADARAGRAREVAR